MKKRGKMKRVWVFKIIFHFYFTLPLFALGKGYSFWTTRRTCVVLLQGQKPSFAYPLSICFFSNRIAISFQVALTPANLLAILGSLTFRVGQMMMQFWIKTPMRTAARDSYEHFLPPRCCPSWFFLSLLGPGERTWGWDGRAVLWLSHTWGWKPHA